MRCVKLQRRNETKTQKKPTNARCWRRSVKTEWRSIILCHDVSACVFILSKLISIAAALLRLFRYSQFQTGEMACQQILFIASCGRARSTFSLCFFHPHSPVQILPSYLPPWQASVLLPTALSPLLLQLYCYPFFSHRFPLWLLSLFFMHAALPSSDSSPQSCLFS